MKQILTLLLTIFTLNIFFAQKAETYKFEDGSFIDVQIINTNPDLGKNSSIYLAGNRFSAYGTLVGYSRYVPEKYLINVQTGYSGAILDGTILFSNQLLDKKLKQSVKSAVSNDTITKHIIEIPIQKRRSYGIHFGTEYIFHGFFNFNSDIEFSASSGIIGLSRIIAKSSHWKVDTHYKERRGTAINTLNIDLVYYFHRKTDVILDIGKTLDDYLRVIVPRLYYRGKASFWNRKGNIGLNYMFGVQMPMEKSRKITLIGGLGLGYYF